MKEDWQVWLYSIKYKYIKKINFVDVTDVNFAEVGTQTFINTKNKGL